jgi:HAD superfamily hydrolase (TIGR01490 family)
MEAAFFDVDKTVIAKASMAAFGRTLYREGLISRRTVLRALWAQLVYLHLGAGEERLARIRESVLTLTRGWDQTVVRQIVREALEEIVDPIIYGEAMELIDTHRAAGRKVYIVSASPEEIVGPLAGYLGVDGAISSRAMIDEDGRYTGEMEFYAYGPYKVDAIRALAEREAIDLTASYAYSDSYTDLPMLEAVGHPVAVNPDRVLLKLAKERDWEVRNFVRPVSLRPRVSAPNLPAAAVAGAVVMGVGGVVGWRLGIHRRRQPVSLPAASWQQRLRELSGRPVSAASSWLPNLPSGWLSH